MNIEIITTALELNLYGYSGIAVGKDYAGTAFKLSGKLWQTIKENDIKNKGKNIWIYEANDRVFAGVETGHIPADQGDLEQKNIRLATYAYHKHIGPYSLIKQAGTAMNEELQRRGFETTLPYIEIYGHWIKDESKLETELLVCLV